MQHDGLAIAGHFQVAVRFWLNLTKMAKQRINIMPLQIVRNRMLEDGIVGAQMRTD
jgi:hypothetical protein